MPPRTAEFAVGDRLEADVFLLLDQLDDLGVFDFLELRRGDLALGALGAGLMQRLGAQQASDMVGTKRRLGPLHRSHSLLPAP